MGWKRFLAIILSLLILFGCAPPGAVPTPPSEKAELIYQRQSFWSQEEFSDICAHKAEFKEDFKMELEAVSQKYKVSVGEFELSFDQETHSTIAKCYVDGAISKSGDRYRGRFGWLLEPLGLDFINDNFEESKTGLSWEGTINGIPISVKVECPPQDCIYKAWQDPVGHCHQHIWWPVSSQKEPVKCTEIRRME